MQCVQKSVVLVCCAPDGGDTCGIVERQLEVEGYDTRELDARDTIRLTKADIRAVDSSHYLLIVDLAQDPRPGPTKIEQVIALAGRMGLPTIWLCEEGSGMTHCFFPCHSVPDKTFANDVRPILNDAVKTAEWSPTRPWRVTGLTDCVLEALAKLTPLNVLKCFHPGIEDHGRDPADWWVLLSMGLTVACWLLAWCTRSVLQALIGRPWLVSAAVLLAVVCPLAIGCWEIWGIVVIQLNILLVDKTRLERTGRPYALVSAERSLVCALLNYATIVFWFAAVYESLHFLFRSGSRELTNGVQALYVSLANMSLMGTDVRSDHPIGRFILLSQLAVGLFMALVVIAQAVGNIQHRSIDER